MKNKYEILTEDLIVAKEKGSEKAKSVDDGGSANLDSIFLILPRWNEIKTIEAIENAGLYCGHKTHWIGNGYLIRINAGQGNKRTVARDEFAKTLKEKGYDVLHFDKVD